MNQMKKQMRRIGYELSRTPLRVPLVWMRHRGLQANDVLLASFPRSGNTWLRFILAEILTGRPIDFDNINHFIPEMGMQRGAAAVLPGNGHLIKTHETYRPEYRRAIYVVRDFRHVVLSAYARALSLGMLHDTSFDEFLPTMLDGKGSRVGSWHDHVNSWLDCPLARSGGLLVMRYEDLRQNSEDNLMKMLDFLGVKIDRAKVQQALTNNTLSRMKSKEDKSKTLPTHATEGGRFVRTGSVASWKDELTPKQVEAVLRHAGPALSRMGYDTSLPTAEMQAVAN